MQLVSHLNTCSHTSPHLLTHPHLSPQLTHVVVGVLDSLWLAPKGLKDVHNMLRNVARSLVAGGQTGVFSPMHMLVFQKPASS